MYVYSLQDINIRFPFQDTCRIAYHAKVVEIYIYIYVSANNNNNNNNIYIYIYIYLYEFITSTLSIFQIVLHAVLSPGIM